MVLNPTTGVAVAAVPVEEEGVGGKLEIAEEEGAIDDVGPPVEEKAKSAPPLDDKGHGAPKVVEHPGVRGSLGGREAAIAGFSRGGSDDGGGDGFSPKPSGRASYSSW